MDPSLAGVFKAYDIRGVSPEQIDASFARKLGRAIALQLHPQRVLVGRDMRTTSLELEAALIEGLTSFGVEVTRIGLCSTPMFNATVGMAGGAYDLGVMVTASHNPGKYNGFKIVRGDCLPIGRGSGMEGLCQAFFSDESEVPSLPIGSVKEDPGALDRYVERVLDLAGLPPKMSPMKIAIDAGNGMAGAVLPRLLARLPWLQTIPLYFDPDGSFPNHEANPLKSETLTRLIQVVRREGCVLGVAFDGDADRIGFVDETGEQIPGDLLTAFLAQSILKNHSGGLVYYDVRSSWSVPEIVEEAGGRAEMCQVGHSLIKRLMASTGAVFAGELSMHFYFQELMNCESGDLAMLLMLRRLSQSNRALSELWKPLRRYVHSGELNFEVSNAKEVIGQLERFYASQATSISTIDGVRMEFRRPEDPSQDWWFNLRASNTEPLLRLTMEARTQQELNRRKEEILNQILAGSALHV